MPRAGGESDKLPNQYEAVWTVEVVLDVFEGRLRSITVEPFGDEALGVEFHAETLDGSLQFHSVKRQKQGGDWSVKNLCKQDASTGRSILGDLFGKRHVHSSAQFKFVSSTGANELRELCERAATPTSVAQFEGSLSAKLRDRFQTRIVAICGGNAHEAFENLKVLEVLLHDHNSLTRSVERRISGLFYRADSSDLRAADVRRMIAEFVLANLGARIDAVRLKHFFDENGLGVRDWKIDRRVNEAVAAANRRYLSVVQTELINSTQIAREAVSQIVDGLVGAESHGALVVAPGGFGKSCVLAQCVSRLAEGNVNHLCLRMDAFEPCLTSEQLGKQMGLPASPAIVLARIAAGIPSVLIVDQLDAMSLVSGRNPQMWEVFQELCEEVRSCPSMKMILACRDFDLEHDHRLRRLGDSQSGYAKHSVSKLSGTEIRDSLSLAHIREFNPDARQLEILSVPFHLLLFLEGDPTRGFSSVGQLYGRYWEQKRQKLKVRLGREPFWNEVLDALTQKMSERQVLFAPMIAVENWGDDARALVSEHVLVDSENHYRFFHESFFDYAFARRFCANEGSVLKLLESTEQHLFRRAQVRQILSYRRQNDFVQYVADLLELLASPKVRFHIKRMVASEFRRIDAPSADEWRVIEPYLLDGDLSRSASIALRDHLGWFDLLDSLGVFENWLASDDARFNNAATWYLEARDIHDSRSQRIAELIAPYAARDGEWSPRIQRIMSFGKAHQSDQMAAIYLGMITRGQYDEFKSGAGSDFWSQHYEAQKKAPKFVIDVLATWFDKVVGQYDDGSTGNFFDKCDQNHSHTGCAMIGEAAAHEPEYFVDRMLPRVVDTVLRTEIQRGDEMLNRAWPYLSNFGDPFDINDAILLHVRRSLQQIAKHDAARFQTHAASMVPHAHRTFAYLLLRSWAENPKDYADECVDYLIADQRRLNVGYGCYSGEGLGESAITRHALKEVSPHCSAERLDKLESAIIGYCDEYEMQVPRQRGLAELLVLRSLDASRISRRAALRIEELERKFPDLTDQIVPEDETGGMHFVGPPIRDKVAVLMTDEQWISAMRKYDGSTDRFRGGPEEMSRVLADFAHRDRSRFASLSLDMPDDIHPVYFSAILNGICSKHINLGKDEKEADEKAIAATPTETFLRVVERLHSLPGRPCGSAIANAVELLSDRVLSPQVLDVLSHYAIRDPDPGPDDLETSSGHRDDPFQYGINCVRGQAAMAIAALLYDDPSRFDALCPALESLSSDPVVAVRTCAIWAFVPVLNFSKDRAVELFLAACGNSHAICATHPFNRFVHFAAYTHYSRIRELLRIALNSANTKAVESAAHRILIAELNDVDVGTDGEYVRQGNETMRTTAADTYSKLLGEKTVGDKCAERLEAFLSDECEAVQQQVSTSFFGLSGERLLELRAFIEKFIESRCFERETDSLLHALQESNVELPAIVCRAAERILEFLGEEGTHIAYRGSMVAHHIVTLIVRQYQQTTDEGEKTKCLDLIDRMERVGYLGMIEELGKIDR